MIKSKNDYHKYIYMDKKANDTKNRLYKYVRIMRMYEYYYNCHKNIIIRELLHYQFKRLSTKYGFSIPINTFGPGLKIIHIGTIAVNSGVIVGANARINCDVVIGAKLGTKDKAPTIGKNVYIAPGAKIIGDISIGDNVIIGAGAVVVSDVPDGVTIAGVPAQIISHKSTRDIFQYFID